MSVSATASSKELPSLKRHFSKQPVVAAPRPPLNLTGVFPGLSGSQEPCAEGMTSFVALDVPEGKVSRQCLSRQSRKRGADRENVKDSPKDKNGRLNGDGGAVLKPG